MKLIFLNQIILFFLLLFTNIYTRKIKNSKLLKNIKSITKNWYKEKITINNKTKYFLRVSIEAENKTHKTYTIFPNDSDTWTRRQPFKIECRIYVDNRSAITHKFKVLKGRDYKLVEEGGKYYLRNEEQDKEDQEKKKKEDDKKEKESLLPKHIDIYNYNTWGRNCYFAIEAGELDAGKSQDFWPIGFRKQETWTRATRGDLGLTVRFVGSKNYANTSYVNPEDIRRTLKFKIRKGNRYYFTNEAELENLDTSKTIKPDYDSQNN